VIKFKAQDLDVHRLRIRDALLPVWDVDYVIKASAEHGELAIEILNRPSIEPVHVFDFYSGLRLVISREKESGRGLYFHVSVSVCEGSHLDGRGSKAILKSTEASMKALGWPAIPREPIHWSTEMIAHLIYSGTSYLPICEAFGLDPDQYEFAKRDRG
jgi:hypothetical protein